MCITSSCMAKVGSEHIYKGFHQIHRVKLAVLNVVTSLCMGKVGSEHLYKGFHQIHRVKLAVLNMVIWPGDCVYHIIVHGKGG